MSVNKGMYFSGLNDSLPEHARKGGGIGKRMIKDQSFAKILEGGMENFL
jgi:hypothetical protein